MPIKLWLRKSLVPASYCHERRGNYKECYVSYNLSQRNHYPLLLKTGYCDRWPFNQTKYDSSHNLPLCIIQTVCKISLPTE